VTERTATARNALKIPLLSGRLRQGLAALGGVVQGDRDGVAHNPCFVGTIRIGRAPEQ